MLVWTILLCDIGLVVLDISTILQNPVGIRRREANLRPFFELSRPLLAKLSRLSYVMVRPLGLGIMPRVHLRLLNYAKAVTKALALGTIYEQTVIYVLIW